MNIEDYNYKLSQNKIAIKPPKVRGSSKLLVLNKNDGLIEHRVYGDIVDYLKPNDTVVLNNTKVIKARLNVYRNGKEREFLLLEKHGNQDNENKWNILHKGSLREKEEYKIGPEIVKVESVLADGIAVISSTNSLLDIANKYGSVPLPPYMHRKSNQDDIKRYQTEFATYQGSVAAPTASLNFRGSLIKLLQKKHINVVYLTLHVGLGTFLPIRINDITKHKMHSEYFEIPKSTVQAIQNTKPDNKVVAIGTTVTRALEFSHDKILNDQPRDIQGEANIFIYPGYNFKIVDGLLTNFHAPKSTVLMMASAFAGWDNLKVAYDVALNSDYKFLSYGDSMLII